MTSLICYNRREGDDCCLSYEAEHNESATAMSEGGSSCALPGENDRVNSSSEVLWGKVISDALCSLTEEDQTILDMPLVEFDDLGCDPSNHDARVVEVISPSPPELSPSDPLTLHSTSEVVHCTSRETDDFCAGSSSSQLWKDSDSSESAFLTQVLPSSTREITTLKEPNIFMCTHCTEVFSSLKKYSMHTKHCGPKKYTCRVCSMVYPCHREAVACKKQHEITLTCEICCEKLESIVEFRSHQRVHKEKLYSCNFCSEKFVRYLDYCGHRKTHKELYTCNTCSKTYSCSSSYHRHQRIHRTGRTPIICQDVCSKKMRCCEFCSEKFMHLEYSAHQMSVHKDLLSCSVCHKTYSSHSNLHRHLRRHPESARCSHCDARVTVHSPKGIPGPQGNPADESVGGASPEEADECGTCHVPQGKVNLGKTFACDSCGKVLKSRVNLKYHIMRHKGGKHVCPKCSCSFVKESLLKLHLARHKEDDFRCKICGTSCIDEAALQSHIDEHGITPYSCSQCPRAFRHKNSLNEHLKRHAGQCHFQCKYCPMSYNRIYNLLRHMRKSHEDALDKISHNT